MAGRVEYSSCPNLATHQIIAQLHRPRCEACPSVKETKQRHELIWTRSNWLDVTLFIVQHIHTLHCLFFECFSSDSHSLLWPSRLPFIPSSPPKCLQFQRPTNLIQRNFWRSIEIKATKGLGRTKDGARGVLLVIHTLVAPTKKCYVNERDIQEPN